MLKKKSLAYIIGERWFRFLEISLIMGLLSFLIGTSETNYAKIFFLILFLISMIVLSQYMYWVIICDIVEYKLGKLDIPQLSNKKKLKEISRISIIWSGVLTIVLLAISFFIINYYQ